MKRPSFQFYPADWRNNAKLRRCSWEARGVWIELLGLLHDSDNYGVLAWPLKEIAQALGAPLKALKELVDKGVLYGIEKGECEPFVYTPRSGRKNGDPVELVPAQQGPVWFSPRMVRDEYVRSNAGASTRFGATEPEKKKTPQKKASLGAERARLRQAVWDKTGGQCTHCQAPLSDDWQIDHYIPRSKGGRGTFHNLVPSCVRCNRDKADTLPDDWESPFGSLSPSPCRRDGEGQGDGSTSSSTSTSTTTPPTGGSVEARQRFEMHLDWQPDELNLKAQCRAMAVNPVHLTEPMLDEFRAFWVNRDTADSQGGWCHRLVKWAKAQLARAAASPSAPGVVQDWAADGVIL